MLHHGIALLVGCRARAVERGGAGVDEVDYAARRASRELLARDALHRLRAPISAHVREYLRAPREEVVEEHRHAVARVVLRGEGDGLARSVPVERGVHQRLGIVAVGVEVGPLSLALEASGNGVVANGLLLEPELLKAWVAVHEVLHYYHHLDDELPVLVFLLARLSLFRSVAYVLALVHHAVLACPRHGFLKLLRVEYAFGHAAYYLREVHALVAHAEIFLEEVGVDNGARDAHACRAHGEIRLAAHGSHGLRGAREAQYLLSHVGRYRVVVEVLHVVPVDAECRQALLRVGGEHGGKVYRSWALRAVESPYRLGPMWVHVHRLGAIAPARRHGDGGSHALALKLLGASRALANAPYGAVGDDALHG